jgi:aerobic C4-dicarboxylate transport protein
VSSHSQDLAFPPAAAVPVKKKRLCQHLYFQVLCAIVIGVLLGHFYPSLGESMKPLGDGFIKLVRMLIAPIIFCTVVHGIASAGDMKKVGRIGLKALIYFEVMTTVALALGLLSMNLVQPGAGMNVDPSTLDTKAIQGFTAKAGEMGIVDYILHIIPNTVVGAFAEGEILQVLLIAVLFAFGLQFLGERGKPLVKIIDDTSHVFFGIVGIIMKVAPIGAFGAMSFTVGKYGIVTLLSLGQLLMAFYATCFVFVFVVLGTIARLTGFSLWRFLRYIKEELLLVLGTSSSESALPRLIAKLEVLGCEKSVVGLVVPGGYSFNLDGSCIMLTTMAIFVAQATNTPLSLEQQLGLLGVLLLTSKGAAGVTGGAFIALAATLASTGTIPVAGLTLVLGVYRFISEAGSLVNLIGNGVATVVVAKWEGALDEARMREHLEHETDLEADEPEKVLM